MAVAYTSVFENIGVHVAQFSRLADIYTDLATYETAVETQYNANSTLHYLGGAATVISTLRSSVEGFHSTILGHVSTILTDKETFLDEMPQLKSFGVLDVLKELYRVMVDGSQTIDRSTVTVGSSTKDHTNSGTGTLLTDKVLDGVTAPGTNFQANPNYIGVTSELGYPADDVVVECTGAATEGVENWTITGSAVASSRFSYQSNNGSGGSTDMTTADGINILSNGGLETWSSGTELGSPWAVTDSGGVVTRDGSSYYLGVYSLKVTGNGSADVFLTQDIFSSVTKGKRYVCIVRYLGNASASAGTLKSYVSGTGFTTEGTGEEIDLDDTDIAAATTWTTAHFFFNVPFNAPSDLKLNIDIENLSNTHTLNIDSIVIAPVVYHAGIAYAVARGTGAFVVGDRFTLSNSNNDAGVFQAFFRDAYGVQLPSSGTPSIADSLGTP